LASVRNKVDLPVPLAPTIAAISPVERLKSILFFTSKILLLVL